tara:strand:+ start:648 stop:2210 length:1563 start_codon:yes stop_codon:yes gene_type:complete
MVRRIRDKLFLILFLSCVIAQNNNLLDVVNWEIYSQPLKINSISEDNSFFYFGTDNAGILRFNKFSQQFDTPITEAQGLYSRSIKHVFYDKKTGILWAVGDQFIEYSFSKTSDWYKSAYVPNRMIVSDIGSSTDYLWIKSGPNFTKLDHINGTNLGTYSFPDESDIDWGDISYQDMNITNFNFNDYFIESGWMLTINGASDNRGKFLKYESYYQSNHMFDWIGLDNGFLLQIDKFTKSIKPIYYGLGTNSIKDSLLDGDFLWIVGEGGITKFDIYQNTTEVLRPEEYFQFDESSISCIVKVDDEIWFGSSTGYILVYNVKKDSFRKFGNFYGVVDMVYREDQVWVSTRINRGLNSIFAIDKELKIKSDDTIPDTIDTSWSEVLAMRFSAKSKSRELAFYQNNTIYISKIDGLYEHRIPASLSSEYDGSVTNTKKIVDSTLYFNGFIRDILVVKEKVFVGTNTGLFIFNLESGKLLERYAFFDVEDLDKFSFLRNIVKINYFSDFLVLLTRNGLIKLSMDL